LRNNVLEKALEETWKNKEKFYEDTKNLSTLEIIKKIENKYKTQNKSRLEDIPYITTGISTQVIEELIREDRVGI
jgi:hypothetical protein